jgi:hypothetical protein
MFNERGTGRKHVSCRGLFIGTVPSLPKGDRETTEHLVPYSNRIIEELLEWKSSGSGLEN